MLLHEPSWICLMLPLCLVQFILMFHYVPYVFWRLPWTTRIWRHPQLHYLQTLRQEGGGNISNFKRREKISWIFLSLKNRRVGEVRVGVPTCRQWNSRRDIISTPFQMIKTLIDQIEDQQSLAMNRALNIMPWMVELIIFQRLIMSIQLGLCSGNPRRTFRNGLHARPMEYHELVAGTPRITREQAGPRENHRETWREIYCRSLWFAKDIFFWGPRVAEGIKSVQRCNKLGEFLIATIWEPFWKPTATGINDLGAEEGNPSDTIRRLLIVMVVDGQHIVAN